MDKKTQTAILNRLNRAIDDEDKTEQKIAELQAHLKEIRIRRKQIQEEAMVYCLNSLKLRPRELSGMLSNVMSGKITFDPADFMLSDDTDESEDAAGPEAEETTDLQDGEADSYLYNSLMEGRDYRVDR